MQDLRVIGVENGSLLVADDQGTRYRLNVDEVLQAGLRPTTNDPSSGAKLAPREIQAHIRSGMTAIEVASLAGVPLESIQRFEGPILAEREYMVSSARAVPVHSPADTDPGVPGPTFGSVIDDRLVELEATNVHWSAWKELGAGWLVDLSFTAAEVEHDARWKFEPKKQSLDPINSDAVNLSRQSDGAQPLIPRLRAVHPDERHPDATRFDSGAFDLASAPAPDSRARLEPVRQNTQPLPELPDQMNQTADLLEALRRRRGEREIANYEPSPYDEGAPAVSPTHPSTGSIRIVSVPLDDLEDLADDESPRKTQPQPTVPSAKGRKGRPSMPSWDEIVFGARPDDDLA